MEKLMVLVQYQAKTCQVCAPFLTLLETTNADRVSNPVSVEVRTYVWTSAEVSSVLWIGSRN